MEVAGLVLGGFPLLVGALKAYPDAARTVREWSRFRTTIDEYTVTLSTQRMIYWDRVIELLDGVLTREELIRLYDGHGVGSLMDVTNSNTILEQRLGPHKYTLFRKHSERIGSSLLDIQRLMQIDHNNTIPWLNAGFVRRERGKFRLVVNKRELQDLFTKIRDANTDLEALTKRNVISYATATRNNRVHKAAYTEDVARRRRQVKSLHKVMMSSQIWKCSCREQHAVSIALGGPVTSEAAIRLKMRVFSSESADSLSAVGDKWWQNLEVYLSETKSSPPDRCNSERVALQENEEDKTMLKHVKGKKAFTIEEVIPVPRLLPLRDLTYREKAQQIQDLCQTLRRARATNAAGQLGCVMADGDPCRHVLECQSIIIPQFEQIPLRQFLGHSAYNKSKSQGQQQKELLWEHSLRLAINLALGVLRMSGSWMQRDLTIQDVLLLGSQQVLKVDEPYLREKAIGDNQQSAHSTSSTLPLLARLIRSDALFSLGLILMQLALGLELEELRNQGDDDTNEQLRDLKMATRLLPRVRGNRGTRYGQVVQACLYVPDSIKTADLDDAEFQTYILANVVSPLMTDLDVFLDPDL